MSSFKSSENIQKKEVGSDRSVLDNQSSSVTLNKLAMKARKSYCNFKLQQHCGESKTQRKWFLDEKRDGLVDENRVNNKENKSNRAVFMIYLFA